MLETSPTSERQQQRRRWIVIGIALAVIGGVVWLLASRRLTANEKELVGDWRVTSVVQSRKVGPKGELQEAGAKPIKRITTHDLRFQPDRRLFVRFEDGTDFVDTGNTWDMHDGELCIAHGQDWWQAVARLGQSLRSGNVSSPFIAERYAITNVSPDERELRAGDLCSELRRLEPNSQPIGRGRSIPFKETIAR